MILKMSVFIIRVNMIELYLFDPNIKRGFAGIVKSNLPIIFFIMLI